MYIMGTGWRRPSTRQVGCSRVSCYRVCFMALAALLGLYETCHGVRSKLCCRSHLAALAVCRPCDDGVLPQVWGELLPWDRQHHICRGGARAILLSQCAVRGGFFGLPNFLGSAAQHSMAAQLGWGQSAVIRSTYCSRTAHCDGKVQLGPDDWMRGRACCALCALRSANICVCALTCRTVWMTRRLSSCLFQSWTLSWRGTNQTLLYCRAVSQRGVGRGL